MFYLIDEKDGLKNDSILININMIKGMKTYFSYVKKKLMVQTIIRFGEHSCSVSHSEEDMFNFNSCLENISLLSPVNYSSDLIINYSK